MALVLHQGPLVKRRTWKIEKSKWWGAGVVLLVSFTASAGFGPVCENCQLPSPSPVTALGLESQIPGLAAAEAAGLGKPFGTYRSGLGLIPAQSALVFPDLLKLSGGATPPATPSWTDRVASGYLPSGFSLLPQPLADPNSFTWNWGPSTAEPGVFSPYLAMSSLWSGMGFNPVSQNVVPTALAPVAIAAGTAH